MLETYDHMQESDNDKEAQPMGKQDLGSLRNPCNFYFGITYPDVSLKCCVQCKSCIFRRTVTM